MCKFPKCSLNEHLFACVCWREFVVIPDASWRLLGVQHFSSFFHLCFPSPFFLCFVSFLPCTPPTYLFTWMLWPWYLSISQALKNTDHKTNLCSFQPVGEIANSFAGLVLFLHVSVCVISVFGELGEGKLFQLKKLCSSSNISTLPGHYY